MINETSQDCSSCGRRSSSDTSRRVVADGGIPTRADLRPLTPRDAVDRFLSRRKADSTSETLRSYRDRCLRFVRWCEDQGLLNLNQLTGRHLDEYLSHRQDSCNRTTLNNEFGTLKKLFEFGVAVEGIEPHIPEKTDLLKPSTSKEQDSNNEMLPATRAQEILEHLDRYERASRDHVIMALLWYTGCRLGGLRALDLNDYEAEADALTWRHRPETGTPLKNKADSERDVSLDPGVSTIVDEYIRHKRIDTVDDHGRQPLITTQRGRIAKNTIRTTSYRWTLPCVTTNECPHDKEIDDCGWTEHGHRSKCPSSRSPHRIRTGSITWMRECGMQPADVAERVDATPETIRHHYEFSDPRKRMEQRRNQLDKLQL